MKLLKAVIGWAVVGLIGSTVAAGQVLFNPLPTPNSAAPGQAITIEGCNFPAGVVAPANVNLTFIPASGPNVVVNANTVTPALFSCQTINLTVPNIVAGSATLTAAGTVTVGATQVGFTSTNFVTVFVNQPAPEGITLNSPASPASALPGTTITLTATGFSTLAIPPADVMVTLQPATGGPSSIPAVQDPSPAGGTLLISFTIPAGTPAGAATVNIASLPAFSPAFISTNSAALTIQAAAAPTVPTVTPPAAAPGTKVTVTASALPGGLTAANLAVTLTPPSGNGGAVTVLPSAYSAATKTMTITVPSALVNSTALVYALTVSYSSGANNGAIAGATITVNPPPTVVDISPAAATLGSNVAVQIIGNFTHFGPTSKIAFYLFGSSVPVTTITASAPTGSTTLLNTTLTVAGNAIPGVYNVTVTTGAETASLSPAFAVIANAALSFSSVLPSGAGLGQNVSVVLNGVNTHWVAGTTIADFGSGITVNQPLLVTGPTVATANITISPTTSTGVRTITVVTGGEFAVSAPPAGGFSVGPSPATLTSIAPNTGVQGTNLIGVVIQGNLTHFLQGATQVSIGGVNVGETTVNQAAQTVTFDVSIPPNAAVGPENVTVTTGGEVVSLGNAFTILAGTPYLSAVSPTTGVQGQPNISVNITGVNTNFQANTVAKPNNISISFGSGDITVNSLTVNGPTSLTANISILQTAVTGGRTVTLVSNTTSPSDYTFNFTVTPSVAQIVSIVPNSGAQNTAPTLQVTGLNTHWVQGTTMVTVAPGPPVPIEIGVVTINGPTSATVTVAIAPNATVGGQTIVFSTGGEIVSGTFTVLRTQATMIMSPTNGMQPNPVNPPTSVPVTFTGDFTHWIQHSPAQPGDTTAVIDGTGVTIQNFTVTSPLSATANFVIAPGAALESHNVTLTTLLAGGVSEVLTANFTVTNSPASLYSITPFHGAPGDVINNVEIVGINTHFASGQALASENTTVGMGPNIAVSNLVIIDATHLTFTASIQDFVALGWRSAFVNTINAGLGIDEELTIGFRVDSPAEPVVTGVIPNNAAQGQVEVVTISGQNTNWQQGVTNAILGAGVTVNELTINNPTSATAIIAVDPLAPIGGNSVVMETGDEVDGGSGFNVVAGPAQIVCLWDKASANDPNTESRIADIPGCVQPLQVAVGETLTVHLVGQATHWAQGETTALFGGAGQIFLDQFAVQDETDAIAQLTILTTAPLGFQSVTLTTLGEVATLQQALDLVNSAPKLLSVTPNGGLQAETLNVQVLGEYTHFCDNVVTNCVAPYTPTFVTTAEASQVIVNSFTAQDSQTGVINVTINPTAFPTGGGCDPVTLTTGAEQVSLPEQFCIGAGGATISNVMPNQVPQGQTTTVTVVGLQTHFENGVTTASVTGNISTGNVTVIDATHASVDLAVAADAGVGFQTVTLTTLGEVASLQQAISVVPAIPTLNEVTAIDGQQGQIINNVGVLGQYTHWCDNVAINCTGTFKPTQITFGQGVTVSNLVITSASTATVTLTIDPITFTGGRTVTATTGTEIESGNFFTVTPGPAIISQVSPTSANQGQEILLQVTGQNTHWQQGLSQFSVAGAGGDITINAVTINSLTSITADISISTTASIGSRGVYITTEGEVVSDSNALVITGGIPAITFLSPSSAIQGAAGVNVTINGVYTKWLTSAQQPDFGAALGSGINVISYTVNSDTSITAIINVSAVAPLQYNTITVTGSTQNGSPGSPVAVQALNGFFLVQSSAPPTPYIQWMSPSAGLPGQTFNVNIYGAYTHWDPATTTATFGAGVNVETFQVLGPNSALATISIDPAATQGPRTVTLTTGAEVENTTFSVVFAVPAIALIDPPSGLQGNPSLTINVLGNYTTFNVNTVFTTGPCMTVANNPCIVINSANVLGPTVAQLNISIDQLAPTGGIAITATTPTNTTPQVVTGFFDVTPSVATVVSVTPNAAKQGTGLNGVPAVQVTVIGEFTHWSGATTFSFGDGITVSNVTVGSATCLAIPEPSATCATMDVTVPALAGLGITSVTAVTGGERATLNDAFVVLPGTPVILSSTPNVILQQQTVPITILGQVTNWDGSTTVTFGPGFMISTPKSGDPDCVGSTNFGVVGAPFVTSPTAMTVCVTAGALTPTGPYNLTVTTADESQTLGLSYALFVEAGPAVLTNLNPNTGGQGQTLTVAITGTNTNFMQGVTTANFGQGVSVNGDVTVTNSTTASVNITIAANANPQFNSVTLTTEGENATGVNAFQITETQPAITFVNPISLAQGLTQNVQVTSLFTSFNASTQFNFGPGVTQNSIVSLVPPGSATVNVSVSPIAPVGTYNVTATTPLGGGVNQVATGTNKFSITAGTAAIATVVPNHGQQNQNGLSVTITGSGTHFTEAVPNINLGNGVVITNTTVNSDTSITVTVNIQQNAAVQTNNVTVTTGGEVATLSNGFTVQAGAPVLTGVSPVNVNQGATNLQLTVNGLYTHFNSGITGATFAPNDITYVSVQPGASPTQAVITVNVSNAAALGLHSITITDPTDVAVPGTGLITVIPGIPAVTSISPFAGSQGILNVPTTINGNAFTHFSPSSVVTFNGSGVTAGAAQFNAVNQITVPVSVGPGSTVGFYSVTVTTPLVPSGTEIATLSNAFQVTQGVPLIQQIVQNVGVANSNQNVTITGVFTNFSAGTTANFGPYISVGGAAAGTAGPVTVNSATSATASLTIANGAALGPYNVTVTDSADGPLTVTNGFTIQAASPVAPTIVTKTPLDGASSVPTNTKFTFELSEPIQNANTGNVVLFDTSISSVNCNPGPAGVVPGTVNTDASGRIVTFSPSQDLKVDNEYLICMASQAQGYSAAVYGATPIQSQGGSPLNLAVTDYTFTTGFGPDTTGPAVTYASISNGDTGVGTNAVVTLGFSEPVNPASVTGTSFYVQQSGTPVAGTISYNAALTQATFTPSPAFAASTTYTVTYTNGITDWSSNVLSNPNSFSFTTGAGSDTTSPSYVSWTPCCGETTGLNPTFSVTLSKPINPLSVTAGTYYVQNQATSWTIPGALVSFSNDNQTVTLTLPGLLDSGTGYSWLVSGYDRDGNFFEKSDTFVTDPPPTISPDTTPPVVSSTNPASGAMNVALNPQIQVQMSKNIDWTSLAGATVTVNPPFASVVGNCALVAGNLVANCGFESGSTSSWTLTGNTSAVHSYTIAHSGSYSLIFDNDAPSGTISQTISDTNGTNYTFSFFVFNAGGGNPELFQAAWDGTNVLNLGLTIPTFGWTEYQFTVVGTGSDTISFTGYNNPAYFLLDDVSVTSTPSGSVSAIPAASFGTDHETVTFASGFLLSLNTSYTATVAGLKDVDGNPMAPFQWSFATSPTSTQLTTNGTITIAPANGTPSVATNAQVVLTFSAPVDQNSINSTSVRVWDNTVQQGSYVLPGAFAVSPSGLSVTFTPAESFEGGHQICVNAVGYAPLYDTSANPFTPVQSCFTIAAGTDVTAPTVLLITPPNGDSGIGPNNPVTVVFSKPMNPTTLNNSSNVGLYTGSTLVTSAVTVSHDTTAMTFNGSLAYGTTYTVVVGPNVTDLAGNPLGSQAASSFSTLARPSTVSPEEEVQVGCSLCVTGFRPGAGATGVNATNPVTFFISAPLNPETVSVGTANTPGTMYVAQNGVLFDGTATLSANNQVITFMPSGGTFTPGVVVEVYLSGGITDTYGNSLTAYPASFTVAAPVANTAPKLAATSPSNGSGSVIQNTVIDELFNQPMNPATAINSNFYLLANNNSSLNVAGTVTALNGNTLLRFTPNSALAASTCYYIYLTGGLANATGQSFAGSNINFNTDFCTGATSDTASTLTVTGIEPTDGSSNIGVNALIRVSFSDAIDPATVSASTLALTSGGTPIPYTFSYNSNNGNVGFPSDGPNQIVLTPQAPLPVSASITVTLTNGITNGAGLALTPTAATFTTGAAPNFTTPQIVSTSVGNGDTNVPVDSVFTITFNEPLDTRTLQLGGNNSVRLVDTLLNTEVAAVMAFSPNGQQLTIAPTSPLAADRQYYFGVCSAFDLAGNTTGCWASKGPYYFTTSLNPAGNLAIISTVPPDTPTFTVGTNFHPAIAFNHPVSEPSAIASIMLTQGGTPVAATLSFSNADTLVTIVPAAILQANLPYVVQVTGGPGGITDSAATFLAATVSVSFNTGNGINLAAQTITSGTPNGVTTGTNPVIKFTFSQPVDPQQSYGWYLQNSVTSGTIALTPTWSPNLTSVTFSYANYVNSQGVAGQLDPDTNYRVFSGYYYDLGIFSNSYTDQFINFTTSTGQDSAGPTVVASTPPNAASGVSLSPVIVLQLSEALDPTTIANAIKLNPSTAGTTTLSNGNTLTFTPTAPLAASTTYSIHLDTNAVYDVNGNGNAEFISSFTTAATSVTYNDTVSLTSPATGTMGVPVGSAGTPTVVTITLGAPVDPLTVTPGSFQVYQTNNSNFPIDGTVAMGAGNTLTFTPTGPLPGNSTLFVYASWGGVANTNVLKDLAGNTFSCLCAASFTTGTAASHAPQIVSVTPNNLSLNNGPNTVVTIAFNEALNQNTVNASNFALYNGTTDLNPSIAYSVDRQMVTLNYGNLPYNTVITVAVGTGIQDLDGNNMAAPFYSTFTTIQRPTIFTPSVVQMRPATGTSGVSLNSPITLYTNSPVNPATVDVTANTVVVLVNGVQFNNGTVVVSPDGQSIVLTPSAPLPASALVQVYLTPGVTDTSGNAFSSFSGQFTLQAQPSNPTLTGPTRTGTYPGNGCSCAQNAIVVETFDQAIKPATAIPANFYLLLNNAGSPIPATVTQPLPNTLALTPSVALAASSTYYVYLTSGLQNLDGLGLNGGSSVSPSTSFTTNQPADTTTPTVVQTSPINGATNIGTNAVLEFVFSDVMDPLSINPATVKLTANGTAVPYTLSITTNANQGTETAVTLTPEIPLTDGATIVLKISTGGSIANIAGAVAAEKDITFTAGSGPDFNGPVLLSESPQYHGTPSQSGNVPTNTTFTYVYNEALSPNSILNNPDVFVRSVTLNKNIPSGVSLSPDGTTVTFAPGPLVADAEYEVCIQTIYDLTGNQGANNCFVYTVASGNSSAPQVLYTTPVAGATGVPTNGLIDVGFNERIAAASLNQMTLTPTSPAGAAIPLSGNLIFDGTVVRLSTGSILAPNTVYQLSIQGVTDLSGANTVTTQSITFTTGPNPQIGSGNTTYTGATGATVTVSGSPVQLVPDNNPTTNPVLNVDDGTTIVLQFSGPVEEASLGAGAGARLFTYIGTTPVPVTVALSNGGTTATITPNSPLTSGTEFLLYVNDGTTIIDQAGYPIGNGYFYYFTAH